MSTRITRNLKIILRAERLIARRRVAMVRRQTGVAVAGAILGGMALVMLNAAAFFALSPHTGSALAASIVAVVDAVLVGILLVWANNDSAESDIDEVSEVRDMAIADLESELVDATAEVRDLASSMRRLGRDPVAAGSSLIVPIVGLLVKYLQKK